mmetsp:Transcript_61269/g.126563  ORF Transcript_61269/g.126563 Transcript_61269/m.126563 type:complete len:372 (-) Transcript_61269:1576-2691(-)
MQKTLHLKFLEKTRGSTWSTQWSNSGNFLFSCGANSSMVVWGPLSAQNFFNLKKKSFLNQKKFSKWNALSCFKLLYNQKAFRDLNVFLNHNELCIGSFSGSCLLFKIEFLKFKKPFFIEIKEKLTGPSSEIKSCKFSVDGLLLSVSGRDRTIWIWEKNLNQEFQCLFIIDNHESDIKHIDWYPKKDIIFSSTYGGFIRAFEMKKETCFRLLSFKISRSSVWTLNCNQNGTKIFIATNEGSLIVFLISEHVPFFPKKKFRMLGKLNFIWLKRGSCNGISFSKINGTILECGKGGDIELVKKKEIWGKKEKIITQYGRANRAVWFNHELSIIRSHFNNINSIVWHPKNESIFASGSEDSIVRIWYSGSFSRFR